MPELRNLSMLDVDEPETAMRSNMDDAKLQELADSIRDIGLKQPICVQPYTVQVGPVSETSPDAYGNARGNYCSVCNVHDQWCAHIFPPGMREVGTRYRIRMGHRRFVAHRMLDRAEIMALVYGPNESLDEAAMLAENVCREDVNDGDIAVWMAELVEKHGYTEEMLIKKLRRSRDWIGDRFRLLRGDPAILKALCDGQIKFAVARELNKCASEEYRPYWLAQAINTGASARQVSLWVAGTPVVVPSAEGQPSSAPAPAPEPMPGAPPIECFCCGGDRDRWNLQVVHVHPWCRDNVVKAIAQSEQA